jgi:hypothetical protein
MFGAKDKTTMTDIKVWRTYEEVAAFLLNRFAEEFGLTHFEGKQKVTGVRSGTDWEIDAKGIRDSDEIFIIVECRRYTKSKQNQENIGALAYRIMDTGAAGGIIISPLGTQEGAKKVASAENIHNVILEPKSTTEDYILKFLNKIMVGFTDKVSISDSFKATIIQDGKVIPYNPHEELIILNKYSKKVKK